MRQWSLVRERGEVVAVICSGWACGREVKSVADPGVVRLVRTNYPSGN